MLEQARRWCSEQEKAKETMALVDNCRIARKLYSFYAGKHLKQPFVLWLDDVIRIFEQEACKDALRGQNQETRSGTTYPNS